MRKVYFFGTSGGCLDAFYLNYEINEDSGDGLFLSDRHKPGEVIYGHKVLGSFNCIDNLVGENLEFVYQCGSVKNHRSRDEWFNKAVKAGMTPRTLVSNKSYIHKTASIGKGSIIYPGVRIMPNVVIGQNCIVLPNTVINHDSKIGDFCIKHFHENNIGTVITNKTSIVICINLQIYHIDDR